MNPSNHPNPKPNPSPNPRPKRWLAAIFLAAGFAVGAAVVFVWTARREQTPTVSGERSAVSGKKTASTAHRKPQTAKAIAPTAKTPRVAFVLDDWGYNLQAFPLLKEINRPMTLAVLPHLPHSRFIAEEGFIEGNEIILHVPMEPKKITGSEKATLFTSMSDEDIRRTLAAALAATPRITGVNNHQGSKATEDKRFMTVVLKTLRDKGYFFLDSMTTQDSVGKEVARELSLPFLKRDVFLDNERNHEAIQARVDELRTLAKRQGFAIGIGHDERITLEVIRDNIDAFEREGIEIVKLSELLKET